MRPHLGSENEHHVFCGWEQTGEYFAFNTTMPTELQCIASGTVDSPKADEHIKEAGYAPTPTPPSGGEWRNVVIGVGGIVALIAVIGLFTFRRMRAQQAGF